MESEEITLDGFNKNANATGIDDLEKLTANDVALIEPMVRGASGLFFRSTCIVDSHHLMLSLSCDAEIVVAQFFRWRKLLQSNTVTICLYSTISVVRKNSRTNFPRER